MRRTALTLVIFVLAGCSTGDASAPATQPASGSADGSDDIAARQEFRGLRDEICTTASDDITEINAGLDAEGATLAEQVTGFTKVVARIQLAQEELDALEAPASLEDFVAEDAARREERIGLLGEMIDALEQEDPDAFAAVDEQLTALNIESESAEDAEGLVHCA